ncbi:hypothetical protein [Salisediminibacterium halotolerans]|uniref:Uncharacterized protein n=1 Tax=Salisediminibacterium halotolerans TaxID=517425 RepID=A0A1H9QI33_9BACI|nr:hypothetical protein [Salisediminibacterium haloalkalitolerans]SER59845.1 hypothetical protein SAMN05444126_10310 [Salisediminibacterium haloalkalitolerans]
MKNSSLLNQIFEIINEGEINYAIIRNYEELPYKTGKDIDVLVARGQINKLIFELKNNLQEECILICSKFNGKSATVYVYNNQLNQSNKINSGEICFHFTEYVSYKTSKIQKFVKGYSKRIYLEDLNTKWIVNNGLNIMILNEPAEFLLLLIHWKKKPKVKYEKKLNDLFKNVNYPQEYLDLYRIDVEYFKKLNFGENTFKGVKITTIIHQLFELIRSKLKHNGKVIFFSGPDGSGKTSNMMELIYFLKNKNIRYRHYYSMQILTGKFVELRKLLKRAIKGEKVKAKTETQFDLQTNRDRNDGTLLWKTRRLVGLITGLLDIIFIGYPLVFVKKMLGFTVIVETSPMDIFIKRHRPSFPLIEKSVAIFKSPDILFLMHSNPKSIVERKPELTEEEIQSYYQRISQISRNNIKLMRTIERIDTSNNFNNSSQKIIQIATSR